MWRWRWVAMPSPLPPPPLPPQKALSIFTYWVWWLPFHAGDLNAHAFMDLWMHPLQPWSHQFFSVNNKWRRQNWNCDFSDCFFFSLSFNFCVVIGLDNKFNWFHFAGNFHLRFMCGGRNYTVRQNIEPCSAQCLFVFSWMNRFHFNGFAICDSFFSIRNFSIHFIFLSDSRQQNSNNRECQQKETRKKRFFFRYTCVCSPAIQQHISYFHLFTIQ